VELIFVGCIISSSFCVTFVFVISMLHLLLLFRCCVFIFGCAHISFVALSCFKGFFLFVFGCACSSVDASSCFEVFCYCCLFVNFSFNISNRLLLLHCALGFNIIGVFMFHCTISMGSIQL